ncbi:hypothetical protein HPB47_007575, partial [Ixodes persulcatus]
MGIIGTASFAVYFLLSKKRFTVLAKRPHRDAVDREDPDEHTMHLTQRERRFIRFASVEYEGQLYMTPEDFLESLTETEPRPRLHRRRLTKKELDYIIDQTPQRRYGSTKLFRNLRDNGIISYTEYLFLLSVLTKPQSGFRIAFNMFDTDGNQRVDKEEFLVVLQILVMAIFFKKSGKLGLYEEVPSDVLEKIFSTVARRGKLKTNKELPELEETERADFSSAVNTTLLMHLFGKKGTDTLKYDDFFRFMDNLQTEVLELEFTEFSRGMPTISEVDFARILLRYTYIHSTNYEAYVERVKDRIPEEKGITFDQFKAFCQFLNNLDDFSIAMRMFTYANKPISQVDWAQLAKQWIQMQQTHPGAELPPQAQHLMASMPPRMSVPPPVQPQQVSVAPALPPHKPPPPPPAPMGGVTSGGGAAPAGYWGNSSPSASTWVVGDGKPWATAGGMVPAVAPVAHPPPPPPPPAVVVPQPPLLGVSEKETFDYGHVSSSQPLASQSYDYNHGGGAADQYGPYGHLDLPPPSYGGPGQGSYNQYWGMGSNPCPPPFLRKDRREVREDIQLPFLEEETPQLDAAKRKSLPAWIREGLEKMEREKLRRLERERAEAEHRERLSKKAQQGQRPPQVQIHLPCHWVFVLILRLSWHLFLSQDSDSEDEKGEGVDMFSDGQRGRRPSPKRNGLQTARDASPDEEPLEPRTEEFRFRTAEERQQELMLKVRRMLTELLLEVTNEEVLSLAKEVLQKAIQK